MTTPSKAILAQLGRGQTIDQVCEIHQLTREQFDEWWRDECRKRLSSTQGNIQVSGLKQEVHITRDGRGLPHIRATNDLDLFFGFGFATAQDRLFQLDYTRRKAAGRLSEILGNEAIESDKLYRTLDLAGIARTEWETLPTETRSLLDAYSNGINALLTASRDNLPIEFDLLDYRPEPWSPLDSLLIVSEFRWYLTGRFPVIVVPELVKRAVGEGPLYDAFLAGEVDDECILPPGSYRRRNESASWHSATGDIGPGSNNWVLAGRRTDTGMPLLASDPHVPFFAVSIWHEVHLSGGSFEVAGVALAGMPAVMIGRNERMAWGVTNNICSQRDLYQEQTDPSHPGCYLFDGQWEAARHREEVIKVRDEKDVRVTVRSSRNGPIVDELLPEAARDTGPVSLRWLGFQPCGWLQALLGINRATNASAFRKALRPWRVPTFSVVFADIDGHIGYQCTGGIPLRHVRERGYRPGADRMHQWDGLIPFEGLPSLIDPPRGFVVTANNRVAHDDFLFNLSGTWVTGYRARRIREQLEAHVIMDQHASRELQLDVYSGRAACCVPLILEALKPVEESDEKVRKALSYLKSWDFNTEKRSIAAAIFNVFFVHWCRAVAGQRLPAKAVELVASAAGPLAVRLLKHDDIGWFTKTSSARAVHESLLAALEELSNRLGDDMDRWNWGRLHVLVQKHALSHRGDLAQLLDHPRLPLDGEGHTVNSTVPDPDHAVWLGAGYRFIVDLADEHSGWWSVEAGSVSGQAGSDYYNDQLSAWHAGELYYTPLKQWPDGPTLKLSGG